MKTYEVKPGVRLPFEHLGAKRQAEVAMAAGGYAKGPPKMAGGGADEGDAAPEANDTPPQDSPDVPLWEGGPTVSKVFADQPPAPLSNPGTEGARASAPAFMGGQTAEQDKALESAEVKGAPGSEGAVGPRITGGDVTPAKVPEPAKFTNPENLDWGGGQPAQSNETATPQPNLRIPGDGGGADLKKLQAGADAEKTGILAGADVEAQKAKAEKDILSSGLTDTQKMAEWQKAHADEVENFVNTQQQRTQAMMRDFQATAKVNPNAYWQNMSVGQKVGNSLALILGGFAGGAGMKNQAQENISQGIKDNINAQVENIKNKRSAIEDQGNLVSQYMKNGMELEEAKHAALATQTQLVNDRLKASAAGYAAPAAQANAQVAAAKLDQETAEHASNLRSASLSRASTAQNMAYQRANEGYTLANRQGLVNALRGGGRLDLSNPEIAARAVKMPDGTVSIAARPEDAEKGRSIVTAGTQYLNAIGRVHEATKAASSFSLIPGGDADKANRELSDALAASKAAAHSFYKIKAGGKEGEGEGGAPEPSVLDELAGKGPVNFLQKPDTLARIQKHHDDVFKDIKDQLRSNNVIMPAEHKRGPGPGLGTKSE